MPELPDLVYISKKLNSILPGQKISGVEVKEPIVIRMLVPQSFQEALKGRRFGEVLRHGPFLKLCLEPPGDALDDIFKKLNWPDKDNLRRGGTEGVADSRAVLNADTATSAWSFVMTGLSHSTNKDIVSCLAWPVRGGAESGNLPAYRRERMSKA